MQGREKQIRRALAILEVGTNFLHFVLSPLLIWLTEALLSPQYLFP
jgi:hypothetical protein